MITLEKIKEIFDHHFNPPFLVEGQVVCRFVNSEELEIKISRRDICINGAGEITAAGTASNDESDIPHEESRSYLQEMALIMNKVGWRIGEANSPQKTDKLWEAFNKAFGWTRPAPGEDIPVM